MQIHKLPSAAARQGQGASSRYVERYAAVDGSDVLEIAGGGNGAAPGEAVQLLFSSGRFGHEGGEWLLHVGLWTPSAYREEFCAWYSIEHLPILLECPAWDGCRFVEQHVADGCQFYALHQLADRSALESGQRAFSRSTAWFKRLKAHAWFDEAFTRTLYRRLE
jgi:hypothetical protein